MLRAKNRSQVRLQTQLNMASREAARFTGHPGAADELEADRAADTAAQSRARIIRDRPAEVLRATCAGRRDKTSVPVRRQRNRAGPIKNRQGGKPIPNWYCEPEAETTVGCGFWPEPDAPGLLRPRPCSENGIHERANPRRLSLSRERNQERQSH
jgi:hypothetical protein